MHPFRAVGYSVHERDGPSASSTHPARFGDAVHAVEYAIWWDWDIQISCEMERVRVCLSGNDQPMQGESSTRSCEGEMRRKRQRLPLKSGRVTHFSEPGKHTFAANPERRCTNDTAVSRRCGTGGGANGARIPGLPGGMLNEPGIYGRHHLCNQLKSQNVVPEFRLGRNFDLRIMPFMPWDELEASIPGRVRAEAKGTKAVLHDSGDRLIDENAQVFREDEIVRQADPIPGGDRLVAEPRRGGFLAALVADWLDKSFENVHKALEFLDLFTPTQYPRPSVPSNLTGASSSPQRRHPEGPRTTIPAASWSATIWNAALLARTGTACDRCGPAGAATIRPNPRARINVRISRASCRMKASMYSMKSMPAADRKSNLSEED